MNIVIGFVLFAIPFALHLIVWKLKCPVSKGTFLIIIFTTIPLLTFFTTVILVSEYKPHISLEELIQGLLISLALSSSYIMTYPLIELESPTLKISNIIHDHKNGIDFNLLLSLLGKDTLLYDRINDLENERAIKRLGSRFFLTTKGRIIMRIFIFWRKLLGGSKGG